MATFRSIHFIEDERHEANTVNLPQPPPRALYIRRSQRLATLSQLPQRATFASDNRAPTPYPPRDLSPVAKGRNVEYVLDSQLVTQIRKEIQSASQGITELAELSSIRVEDVLAQLEESLQLCRQLEGHIIEIIDNLTE